ncbi:MAG: Gfo/Idh/MocA family oxidoreductase, partial [bacterium]|nr:Gfo/Idh/MocA family oxidoreductase [bacterium]
MISRRTFLLGSLAVAGTRAFGAAKPVSANEKLNIACVGVGGRGCANLAGIYGENTVALCDVDQTQAALAYRRYPKLPRYTDFRVMLEKEQDIDAVVVSTPDHMHATVAQTAMALAKHVYVEKPMAHTVGEARSMAAAAKRYGVATQMGNQGHSGKGVRQLCAMIASGAIGPVREVHAWTNRPTWPQGLPAPEGSSTPPDTLDWDLWLGSALDRPFVARHNLTGVKCYCPLVWRGWWDFGGGALGDMGCHILDPVWWALKLGAPEAVECVSAENATPAGAPTKSVLRYEFPARGDLPPVKVHWYDGRTFSGTVEGVDGAEGLQHRDCGSLFVGDDGCIVTDEYGQDPRLLPDEKMQDYTMPDLAVPESPG